MRKKIIFHQIISILCLGIIIFSTQPVYAKIGAACNDENPCEENELCENRKCEDKATSIQGIADLDPIKTSPQVLIGRIIKSALGITGSLALIIMIYAGIRWMTARGKADEVQKAQDTIFWAVLGLAVIFASYAIVNFIITNVKP